MVLKKNCKEIEYIMYRLRIIGDPILREKTKPVTEFDKDLQSTVDKMIKMMHKEDGIGLAAPQVGLMDSILVVDISPIEEEEQPRAFINPQIVASDGESVIEEGCLSVPGVREDVRRPEKITLQYQDTEGKVHNDEYDGWLSRVIQHEIDHLNGKLFVDYLSPMKRQMLVTQGMIPEVF
jgi:peptide deformylase